MKTYQFLMTVVLMFTCIILTAGVFKLVNRQQPDNATISIERFEALEQRVDAYDGELDRTAQTLSNAADAMIMIAERIDSHSKTIEDHDRRLKTHAHAINNSTNYAYKAAAKAGLNAPVRWPRLKE